MAAKKTSPTFVWVFHMEWEDRHGEQGSNVKVFETRAKAIEYLISDVKNYFDTYDGYTLEFVNGTGIDSDTMDIDVFSKAVKSEKGDVWLEVNVDGSGTNASWVVSTHKVL